MDWEKVKKVALLANIGAFFVGITGVLVALAWFAYTVWIQPSSSGSNESVLRGEPPTMKAWLPALIIGVGLVLAAIFNLIAAFMLRRKLKAKITDLTTANQTLTNDLKIANREKQDWQAKYNETDYERLSLLSERENLELQLKTLGIAKHMIEGDLETARHEAKQANLRANEEINQKNEFARLYHESERKLDDFLWLRNIADTQAKNISEHVKATVITYPHTGSLVLSGEDHLRVTVGLVIRNESVFDITIRPQDVSGHLSFKNQLLKEPASLLIDDFRDSIDNLKPMQSGVLVLEQLFRQAEAETITKSVGDNNAYFWIGNLAILISVGNTTLQVEPKRLRITAEAEKILLTSFKRNTNND